MEDVIESVHTADHIGVDGYTVQQNHFSPVPDTESNDDSHVNDGNSSNTSASMSSVLDGRPITEHPALCDVLNRDNNKVTISRIHYS